MGFPAFSVVLFLLASAGWAPIALGAGGYGKEGPRSPAPPPGAYTGELPQGFPTGEIPSGALPSGELPSGGLPSGEIPGTEMTFEGPASSGGYKDYKGEEGGTGGGPTPKSLAAARAYLDFVFKSDPKYPEFSLSLEFNRDECAKDKARNCLVQGVQEFDLGLVDKARIALTKSCNGEEVAGCTKLGALEWKSRRKEEAREAFREACTRHDTYSCSVVDQFELLWSNEAGD